MKLEKINLGETGNFSPLFLDYLNQKDSLKAFYNQFPETRNFKKLIEERNFNQDKRNVLFNELTSQYQSLEVTPLVTKNLSLLKETNTFTVTTGHQLNIFTGPLYFIYKIVTTINTCEVLSKAYPRYDFVPVYWMASEDHDFDEISYFNLFNQKHQWQTDQTGPVGRFSTESIQTLIKELPEKVEIFEKAYSQSNLADAVRQYVNEIFGSYGLIVVDADSRALKSLFTPVIKNEFANGASNLKATETTEVLEIAGYKSQIFSREINLFYLENGLRERFEKNGDKYQVLNTELSFSAEEIETLIESKPECFSPNVVLRPLYQEIILPNIAYIGGPAEIAYWLQLKGVFDASNVPFPALMPRNFGLVINKSTQKKIEKVGLSTAELFKDTHEIKTNFVDKAAETDFNLNQEKDHLDNFFGDLKNKASEIDGSLEGYIGAERAKAQKMLDNIEKRLKKSEEKKHETALSQIDSIKEKLFPNGSLQERTDNFLNFYLNNPNFIQEIKDSFDPFDFRFNILIDQ